MDAGTAIMLSLIMALLVAILLVVLLRPSPTRADDPRKIAKEEEEVIEFNVFIDEIETVQDLENVSVRYVPFQVIDIIADVIGTQPMLEFQLPEQTSLMTEFNCLASVDNIDVESVIRITGDHITIKVGDVPGSAGTLMVHCDLEQ